MRTDDAARTIADMDALPVIDLSRLDEGTEGVAVVARAIDDACQRVGFFSVVGHGIDPGLRERLDELARAFFALPEEHKAQVAMERGGRAWRGWFPLGGELTSGVPDHKEGLYFGTELDGDDPRVVAGVPLHGANLFPVEPAGLEACVLEYLDALGGLAQRILSAMAVGLGLDPGWFFHSLTADPTVLFRIFRYPPAVEGSGRWGVGPHTDYGLLTLLGQDGHEGLEVKVGDRWVAVPADPDAFMCNLGDMLERLTGGRYVSTVHRVVNTSGMERLSYPFFFDPGWEAQVEALPIVGRPTGAMAAERWDHANLHGYVGIYGDYLTAKVGLVFPRLAAGEL